MDNPVSDWEEWTGMQFPADGDYVVPEMLAPLHVRDGRGPPCRAERLATAPALAALALAGPLELAAHLAVLGDVLGLVGGCVEVGLALGSAEP